MFRCACEPPALPMLAGAMGVRLLAGPYKADPVELDSSSEGKGVLVVAGTLLACA